MGMSIGHRESILYNRILHDDRAKERRSIECCTKDIYKLIFSSIITFKFALEVSSTSFLRIILYSLVLRMLHLCCP